MPWRLCIDEETIVASIKATLSKPETYEEGIQTTVKEA